MSAVSVVVEDIEEAEEKLNVGRGGLDAARGGESGGLDELRLWGPALHIGQQAARVAVRVIAVEITEVRERHASTWKMTTKKE